MNTSKKYTPGLVYRAKLVDDSPDLVEPEICYIVEENKQHLKAVFKCPCGCGLDIVLNLIPTTRPRWILEIHPDNTVTFSPSINRNVGCKSHFFLRKGRAV